AISNIRGGAPLPLNIEIPQTVWILLGISTTSLVGAPLVLSAKRATPAAPRPTTTPDTPATPALPLGPTAMDTTAPVATPPPTPVTPSRRPLPVAVASVLRAQGEDPARMSVDGSVVVRHSVYDASWADLFKGDEVGDITTLDLSKIQMFFFTVV